MGKKICHRFGFLGGGEKSGTETLVTLESDKILLLKITSTFCT